MRGSGGLLGLALVGMGLAGCLAQPAPEGLDPSTLTAPALGLASGLPLARAAAGATLEAAPSWALGEWWRYEVESLLFGERYEVTRVVAGAERDHYLVGMPAEDFHDAIMVFHFPGFGQVDRATLSFEAHDLVMQHLQFPLAEGATWTTKWYNGDDMPARVVRVEGPRATIALEHPLRATEAVYDAALGEVSELTIEGYLRYRVVDHGFGFRGAVLVPYAHDLVVCHGRVNGVQAIEGCAPAQAPGAPADTVTIQGDYDRLSFALIARASPLGPVPAAAPGLFQVEVEAPDGTTYQVSKAPLAESALASFGHDAPVGDWRLTAVAGGPGSVLFEGPAYRTLRADL